MERKLNSEMLDPENDIMFVMDKLYYTFSGAKKMTGLKDSALRSEMKKKMIEVFKYPVCDLFSPEAIRAWIVNKTVMAEKKKKK